MPETRYRGRFAPSPTGPLHLGSLIAALASYLDARHHSGQWRVRMEDLDPPREEAGAAESILTSLQRHGLLWDEEIMYQGARDADYDRALAQLAAAGHLFHCDCTRAMLGPGGACGGRCAPRQDAVSAPYAIRIQVPSDTDIRFVDQVQGAQQQALGRELPDFTLRRKDSLTAYQLAVVVDDAAQGITHVVRGSDLLDSTPRQIFLQRLLGLPQPHYCHLPVITSDDGQKFSKQNLAPALDNARVNCNLRLALRFLGQPLPPGSARKTADLLDHAIAHWSPAAIPRAMAVTAATIGVSG